MPLPLPNLDDRDYARLLADAKALIPAHAPEWTDLSPGDPGVTLLELFAFLTESMIFRLNRIPEKAHVAFLNLIGVTITPPASASVALEFSLRAAAAQAITMPRGTRITTTRPNGPVFTTLVDVVIPAGATSATGTALHCDVHFAEDLGTGTGRPGQMVRVRNTPIVLDSGETGDLYVGVEAGADALDERAPAIHQDGVTYRLWREVPHFGVDPGDGYIFTVDRNDGVIGFSPFAGSPQAGDGQHGHRVPAAGRRILVWYRSGGGVEGNVRPHTLTVLKDPVAGVQVDNTTAAVGGRAAESLEAALRRGAHQVTSYDRVVTAQDYERAAIQCTGGVSRALALTAAALWQGAPPGEVQVLVLPSMDAAAGEPVSAESLALRQRPEVLQRVAQVLQQRQPLGVTSSVGWVGLKSCHVEAGVVVNRAEDADAVARRLTDRLAAVLSPLPAEEGRPGWRFGEALRASTVYDVLLGEKGVRFVDSVRLVVDDVPDDVTALIADPHQPDTWFCASGERIFRSTDDADGWERLVAFAGETVERLTACPGRPGTVVASTRLGAGESCRVQVTIDHGESWRTIGEFDFHVEDLAAAVAGDKVLVFLATDKGLFRLALAAGAVPESVIIEAATPAKPCYAVQVLSEPGAELQLAVAAQELGGVFVSFQGGRSGTFQPVGLSRADIRVLRVQRSPGRRFLLAGAFATGDEAGAGVSRLELLPYQPSVTGWAAVGSNWIGGSCRDIATVGERVYAATARSAIVTADIATEGRWTPSAVDSGLPLREVGRFRPLSAVAARDGLVLTGCAAGVYGSRDGRAWSLASGAVFTERVALPRTWLFAPGAHTITVRYDDARP